MLQSLLLSVAAMLGQSDAIPPATGSALPVGAPQAPVKAQLLPPSASRIVPIQPTEWNVVGEGAKNAETKEEKNGDACNGNCEEEEEEECDCLMKAIECRCPDLFHFLECRKTKIYGWVEGGFTGNVDSPRDRANYGVWQNRRSNDVQLNEIYMILERPLEKDQGLAFGHRVDFMVGHNAPLFANVGLGLFDNFTGNRLGVPGTNEFGIDLPQFYVEAHLPILTDGGLDVRIGRFWTLMGGELSPANQTDFYSHSYEWFHAVPFTHTGVMFSLNVNENLVFHNCFVRGWEVVFQDINDVWAYMGGLNWTSPNKKGSFAVAWITSPEQIQNNDDWRTVITAYYTRKFGPDDKFRFVTGGNYGWEDNALTVNGVQDAEWYGYSVYLFNQVSEKTTLGVRGEWFRDDDGSRTAYYGRPGFADSFYEVTLGATCKLNNCLRVRPEVRFDWANHSRAYNDQTDRFQTTLAIDFIWQY